MEYCTPRRAMIPRRALFPSYRPEPGILQRSEGLLADLGGQNPVLERKLREANDELERTYKCQEFARS